jgi:hypothetical protein
MDAHKWADWASVLTFLVTFVGALVGVGGYLKYRCEIQRKGKRLEAYLRAEKRKGADKGQRSILRISSDVGLTGDEIIQASFRNPHIGRRIVEDEKGFAKLILFEYKD